MRRDVHVSTRHPQRPYAGVSKPRSKGGDALPRRRQCVAGHSTGRVRRMVSSHERTPFQSRAKRDNARQIHNPRVCNRLLMHVSSEERAEMPGGVMHIHQPVAHRKLPSRGRFRKPTEMETSDSVLGARFTRRSRTSRCTCLRMALPRATRRLVADESIEAHLMCRRPPGR